MLILSRKQNESIVIGDSIIVKVVGIDKGSVKLGFEAPPKTLILRAELKEAIQNENTKASHAIDNQFLDVLTKSIKAKKEINAKDIFKKGLN